MHAIHLSDALYSTVKKKARAAGFLNVEDYIADLVEDEVNEEDDFEKRFTPEVIAHLDRICERVDAGEKTYTLEEVGQHIAETRKAWLRKNQG